MRWLINSNKRGLGITATTTLLLLAILELRHPFYFLQDDGLEYFLPSYAANWRSVLSGHLPLYDFHTFGGLPHASMGQPACFYLPEYIGLSLSRLFWGHLFATIDLMAMIHLLLAVAGTYLLLRHLSMGELPAIFGGLTALSGFALWSGRMWPIAVMLCAWFPWMVLSALRYMEKPGTARAAWLVCFRLGLLYGGYPQFFVLAMIFEHLFVLAQLLFGSRRSWRSLYARYFLLNIPVCLLGLPFLLPMAAEMQQSLARSQPVSFTMFTGPAITPFYWIFAQFLSGVQLTAKQSVAASMPYLSYVGLVTTLLSFFAIPLLRKRGDRQWGIVTACFSCWIFALLWSWNALSHVIYHLPLLNRFTGPFKLVYFAGFFQCVLAALALTRLSRRWHYAAIAAYIVGWIWTFCFLPTHAWRVREYHPPLASPWSGTLKNGRYLIIGNNLVDNAQSQFVAFDYAELWGLDDLLGYEPLISQKSAQRFFDPSVLEFHAGTYFGPVDTAMLDQLRKWSVRYVLVSPDSAYASDGLQSGGFHNLASRSGWTLWEDPNAVPRVRWNDAPGNEDLSANIQWTAHPNSIDISLRDWPGRDLVLAFSPNPGLRTCLDRHCTPVKASPDGLIHIFIPPGTRQVRVVYDNPFFVIGGAVTGTSLIIFLFLAIYSARRDRFTRNDLGREDFEPAIQSV